MKKLLFFLGFILITLMGSCQDQTFDKVVTFNSGFRFTQTGQIYTSLPSGTVADWNTLLNKPVLFDGKYSSLTGLPTLFNGTWTSLTGKPNFDLLYKPFSWVPNFTEIVGKPTEQQLKDAIPTLDYLPIPQKTTVQINALVMPAGATGIIFDSTLGVYKLYKNGVWSIQITGQ
jgi:hypothetical protein